jgi:hypothetical protein
LRGTFLSGATYELLRVLLSVLFITLMVVWSVVWRRERIPEGLYALGMFALVALYAWSLRLARC